MLCDKCKKNVATYHSQTIINGVESSEHLCSECAKKLNRDLDFGTFDSLGLFDAPLLDMFDDRGFFEDNMLGDYDIIDNYQNRNILNNALNSVKKGADNYNQTRISRDPEIDKWEKDLKQAVLDEDYEKAAELKKKIDDKKNLGK